MSFRLGPEPLMVTTKHDGNYVQAFFLAYMAYTTITAWRPNLCSFLVGVSGVTLELSRKKTTNIPPKMAHELRSLNPT